MFCAKHFTKVFKTFNAITRYKGLCNLQFKSKENNHKIIF